ncbi:hypothetical protein [Neolewinella persica]|uniref:hypothetical protein n=1 Tax=Neolewinella persica TaxID=70998 RepID=UPI0003772978|nr:hypothetical protein [Neolewinella persica]
MLFSPQLQPAKLLLLIALLAGGFGKLAAQLNETHRSLYQLSVKDTKRGTITTSKAAPGYVTLPDGTKVEGDIEVTLIGDSPETEELQGITLQTAAKQLDLQPIQIASYGLQLTIQDYLGKATSPNRIPGFNFHPGSITLLDGEVLTGFVAFQQQREIWKSSPKEYFYSNVLFTESEDGYLKFYETKYLDEATQIINGQPITYQYLDNKFIAIGAMDGKLDFAPGSIRITGGKTLKGQVGIGWVTKVFADEVFLKDEDGKLTLYRSPGLKAFTVGTDNYAATQGKFVLVEKENSGFQIYRNPFPTSENGLGMLVGMVAASAQAAVQKEVVQVVSATNGKEDREFNKAISEASDEELAGMGYALEEMRKAIPKDAPNAKKMKAELAAKRIAVRGNLAVRQNLENNLTRNDIVTIMKKEWIILNKTTNEETVILKEKFRQRIEPVLLQYSKYAMLDKKEKKQLLDWDNLDGIMAFLETCIQK